MKDEIIKYIK